MLHRLQLALLRLLCLLFIASLGAAALLRIAPGFSSDEQELNPGLSASSIQAIRNARLADSNIPAFYGRYVLALFHGDLGVSRVLNRPVGMLLRERFPVTAKNLGLALVFAWIFALALGTASQLVEARWLSSIGDGLSSAFISTPAAVLALIFVMLSWPPVLAAALLIFPKLYRYLKNLLQQCRDLPHVLAARSRGASRSHALFHHVTPVALPQLVALVGVSINMGLGVLLPIEVICGVPGIGQLAWQAAQSRDLTLLVNLTLIVSLITVSGTMLSDAFQHKFDRSAA